MSSGQGSAGLLAPKGADEWSGTFGSFIVCSETGGPVVIEDVRWETKVAPERVEWYLRTVQRQREQGSKRYAEFIPLITALGSPPRFAEPYVTNPVSGSFTKGGPGVVVDVPCDSADGERAPGPAFEELLFVLHVDESGGHLSSAEIEYTADGERHVYPIEWEMLACGEDLPPERCTRKR